jgi:hypothetical protein
MLCEGKLSFDFFEVAIDELSTVSQRSLEHTLAVYVKNIEQKDANLDIDALQRDVLSVSGGQSLKGTNPIGSAIKGYDFAVQDEVLQNVLVLVELSLLGEVFFEKLHNIRVGFCHVVQVSAVNENFAVCVVKLTSESIVLELASEPLVFESLKDHLNAFCWLG